MDKAPIDPPALSPEHVAQFRSVFDSLAATINSYVGDRVQPDEVDAITQTVFVKLWAIWFRGGNIESLDLQALKKYCTRLARNVVTERHQLQQNRTEFYSAEDLVTAFPEVQVADQDEHLLDILRMLQPRERAIVELLRAGETLESIAKALGLSISSVHMLSSRARKKIRELMESRS